MIKILTTFRCSREGRDLQNAGSIIRMWWTYFSFREDMYASVMKVVASLHHVHTVNTLTAHVVMAEHMNSSLCFRKGWKVPLRCLISLLSKKSFFFFF